MSAGQDSDSSTGCPSAHVLRTWLLTNAPSPYQAELLTAAAGRSDLDLNVRFMRPQSSSGRAVESHFKAISMLGLAPRSWRDEVRLHPRAIAEAAFGRFDCFVLSGLYTSVTFLCCAILLSMRRKAWIIWLERPHADASLGRVSLARSVVRRIRDGIRRWLVRSASRVLCIGRLAAEEYGRLGAEQDKLDVLPYCCHLNRYDEVPDSQVEQFKDRLGLHGKTVFLYSGQLIPRKGVETLIQAFGQLADRGPDAVLVLLGDGPLREKLESLVAREHRAQVHFLGHLPQAQLPAVFRAADVFVFPSRHDGWAVVINEACASRLPVIASQQTGAAHDLVEHGVSGFRHDADDVGGFYESMKSLANDSDERIRMGNRSRELVEPWTPERGAQRLADSVRRAVNGRRRSSLGEGGS